MPFSGILWSRAGTVSAKKRKLRMHWHNYRKIGHRSKDSAIGELWRPESSDICLMWRSRQWSSEDLVGALLRRQQMLLVAVLGGKKSGAAGVKASYRCVWGAIVNMAALKAGHRLWCRYRIAPL